VQAAVAGGLGVTTLGRTFVMPGTRILEVPEQWPVLPMTEIVFIGEEAQVEDLVRPLVSFLTESLSREQALAQVA
jgi:hypothetical protein